MLVGFSGLARAHSLPCGFCSLHDSPALHISLEGIYDPSDICSPMGSLVCPVYSTSLTVTGF